MTAQPGPDTQVGMKAVEAGLITEVQLADVRRELSKQAKPPSLPDALIARGLLTRLQVEGFRSGDLSKRIGKYRLIRELGRGGMGVVYEAEDVELKRKCALKTMIEAEGIDARERAVEEERFVREARLSANLPRHPGIVGVYDAGVIDGRRVIAMELVDGPQFQEWRRKAGFRQQIQALKDVADAVAHAHAHNVVHRDLKPSNILVDGQRKPRVTDFGLAKRSRETTVFSLTATGMIVGTPAYMSPEQAEAKDEVGPATDQWALGVMLYEILAGRLPFQGASAVEVLMKTVKEPVIPPTKILRAKGAVDERLERLCMRALKKEPAERFPSVKAFAEGLGAWLKGGTIRKAPAKRPAWMPAAVGAGILFAVLALFLLFRSPGAAAVDVSGLVADGRRLIEKKKYADALISFGRALAEDPENAAAKAGKREAERLLTAPAPDTELVAAVRKLIADEDVKAALAKLDGVPEPARTELRTSLHARMDALFARFRDRAVEALKKNDKGQAETLSKEVEAWKRPDLSAALKAALAAVPPPPRTTPGAFPELHNLEHGDNGVTTVSISPDGRRVLSGSFGGLMKVWDLETKRPVLEVRQPTRPIVSDFSRDGRWFAVGLGSGDILVYDAKTLAPRAFKGHEQQAFGTVFSVDSLRLFTCATDCKLRVWTVADGAARAVLGHHGQGAMALARSSDGRSVAVGATHGEIKIWDTVDGRDLATLTTPSGVKISGLAYSPDGARLASGDENGGVLIWDVKSGARREFVRATPMLHNLAWSPDGRWIAVASADPFLRVYDAASGAVKAAFDKGGWYSCVFSADSRRLVGGTHDFRVRIYDISALK